jgi:hypothetical protein
MEEQNKKILLVEDDPIVTSCKENEDPNSETHFEDIMLSLFNEIIEYRKINQLPNNTQFRIDEFSSYITLRNDFTSLRERWLRMGGSTNFSEDEVYAKFLGSRLQIHFASPLDNLDIISFLKFRFLSFFFIWI